MADEMSDGNVAYSMELEEGWLRGIPLIPGIHRCTFTMLHQNLRS